MDEDLESMSRELLPEKTDPVPVVPEWPQFMAGCIRYRQSLDKQAPTAANVPAL